MTPPALRPMPTDILDSDRDVSDRYREAPSLLNDYSDGWNLADPETSVELQENETVPDYINRAFAENPLRWEAAMDGWEDAAAGLDFGHQVFCAHHGQGCGFVYGVSA